MWIENLSNEELIDACFELGYLKNINLKSPDEALSEVRNRMTITTQLPSAFEKGFLPQRKKTWDGTPEEHWVDEKKLVRKEDTEKQRKLDDQKSRYWDQVKKEIRILLCTKDRKYTKLRKNLDAYAVHSKQTIVAIVAAGIGSSIGIAGGIITGLVAIALFAIARIGISAYCALEAG